MWNLLKQDFREFQLVKKKKKGKKLLCSNEGQRGWAELGSDYLFSPESICRTPTEIPPLRILGDCAPDCPFL